MRISIPNFRSSIMRLAWRAQSGTSIDVATWVTALLLVSIILLLVQAVQQRKRKLPPGPRPWPVVGNFPTLMGELPYKSLQRLATQYGGLMYLRLGSVPCIVISTSAAARELFQKNDAILSSRPQRLACTVICETSDYKNLCLAPYGPYWLQLRKFCIKELFSARCQSSFESARAEEVHTMMKELVNESKKEESINLRSWLKFVTSNIMTRMLINRRYFGSGGENREEKKDFELLISRTYKHVAAFVVSDYVPYLSFITKLQGWPSKFENVRDELRTTLLPKIFKVEEHQQRAKERGNDEKYVPDFVDVLLTAPLEDGKPLSDKDIALVLLDLFLAGQGNSATTVEWAMSELILKPDLIKQAQKELDNVVGRDCLVQESDLPNLPYLKAIIKETFRLHPPASISLPRELVHASKVLEYDLPAKTTLLLNIYAIQRDPSVYQDPNTFDPQRFVEHPEVNHTSGNDFYELIPFGVGRRMCPGYNLGNMMTTLILASLLHSFDWSLPKDQCVKTFDMSEVFEITTCRTNPLFLIAKPRSLTLLS